MSNGKIAFVFPGQGAQKTGMVRNLCERFPIANELMKQAGATLGFDLGSLCANGPEEMLGETQNTQPALLTAGAAALAAFRTKCGVTPDFVAGHSLGEFTALYCAGSLSFNDAVTLVRKRGEYMAQASGGGMAAVLGLDTTSIEAVCNEISGANGALQPANYNGEGQTVIAGHTDSLERAIPLLKERGAKRVVPLKVSAAFHTPFMQDASERLARDLDATTFADPAVSLVNNVDAKIVDTADEARDGVKRQVTGAVRWTDVMRVLVENGVRTVVEFGVGRTLLGMFKKVDPSLTLCHVEDEKSLMATVETLS